MGEAAVSEGPRSRWLAVMRWVGFATALLLAALVGRLTFDPTLAISLVWPAYGVGALWLASGNRRTWPFDLAGIALVTTLSLLIDGASAANTVVGIVAGLGAAVIWLLVFRRLSPDAWGGGGRARISTLADVMRLLVACLVAGVVIGVVRGTGMGLLPAQDWHGYVFTTVRNVTGLVGFCSLGLLVLPRIADLTRSGGRAEAIRALELPDTLRRWEYLAVLTSTLLLIWLAFSESALPVLFTFVMVVVWAAFRTGPTLTVLLALTLGIATTIDTVSAEDGVLAGRGPFEAAAVAQGFLSTLLITGLVVSFATVERRAAIEQTISAEQEAARRAHLLTTVVENLHEGILVTTVDGQHMVTNPATRAILARDGTNAGSDAAEVGWFTLDGHSVRPPDMPGAQAFAGHDVLQREYLLRTAEGERFVLVTAIRVEGALAEGLPCVLTTVRDVTREHEDRDQLRSFSGVVAHDLKNPLTVIQGWASAMSMQLEGDGAIDRDSMSSMLDRVRKASVRMSDLIDDLLDFTVARDRQLNLTDVDLSALADEVSDLRRAAPTSPRISVQPGLRVVGDRPLLRQLLDNLIGNAVKYVDVGVQPVVSVSGQERGDQLEVAISDNGIGILPAAREKVFDSFTREHDNRYAGTGLGLAICHRVVTRHGGDIWVDPATTRGTRVVMRLPRTRAAIEHPADDVTQDPEHPEG